MNFEKFVVWLKANCKGSRSTKTLGGGREFDAEISDDGKSLLLKYGEKGNFGFLLFDKVKLVWDRYMSLGGLKLVASEYTDPSWAETPNRILAPYAAALIRDFESDSLIRNSLSAINSVIEDFHANPYYFLYESDLQFDLFKALRERIRETVLIPGVGNNQYVLNLIYSEYLDKIDIACIDPEAISNMDTSSLGQYKGNDTYIYNLPVFLGIELKYIHMGYRKGFDILERDYLKLTRDSVQIEKINNWVVLGFIQRKEEADPFLENADSRCRLLSIDTVEQLNGIYIVTPDKIFSAQLK